MAAITSDLIARSASAVDPGPYAWGSLVELTNLVPRALGIFQEQYSFDRYMTEVVWGQSGFSQIFVGRIGESFFVLGFGGFSDCRQQPGSPNQAKKPGAHASVRSIYAVG